MAGSDLARESVGTGATVHIEGAHGVVAAVERTGESLSVLVDFGDRVERMPFAEFCRRALPARAKLEKADRLVPPDTREWHSLPDRTKQKALGRARHLLEILTGSSRGNPEADRAEGILKPPYDPETTTFTQRLETKSSELRTVDDRPWSRAQVFRQVTAFQKEGLLGLIHSATKTSKSAQSIDPEVERVLGEFLESRGPEARVSDRRLAAMARAALQNAGVGESLKPSELADALGELTRSLAFHRESRSRARHDNKPRAVYGRLGVSRPGEVVQIDATATSVACWFPEAGWYRANVLTAIDVYSRRIVALRVTARAVTSRDVGLLLWDIGRPEVTRGGWPYSLERWQGMPRLAVVTGGSHRPAQQEPKVIGPKAAVHPTTIVLDHGRENTSTHLLSAAHRAGIDVIYSPPAAPHTKGIVESWHNTLVSIQELLPGFKGASPANHPAGIEKRAVLTVADLHDALWEYILTVYDHRPHAGLKDPANPRLAATPALIFDRYMETGGYIEVPRDPYRLIDFLSATQCRLQDYGINLNKHIYSSPELLELRGVLQRGTGKAALPMTVHYDRWDLSRVYLRHPVTNDWLCVPRWDPDLLALPPHSELLAEEAIRSATRDAGRELDPREIHYAEAKFCAAWARGDFEDARMRRIAAAEAARATQYAHDLEDATDEFRDLAFPSRGALAAPITSYESDDDEVLDYGDVEPYGFAL